MRARSLVAILAALASALGACSLGENDPGGDGEVEIGLIVALSGVYAAVGQDMKAGFELYLAQRGGKLGGHRVRLVTVDEGEGPQTGVPAATRLVQRDRVHAAVGIVSSPIALGVRDMFTEARTPLIVSNAGADAITGGRGSPYLWRTSFANGEIAASIARHVARRVGRGSVYLLGPDYAAGEENLAGFRRAFEAEGGRIAGQRLTPFGETQDFQPYLSAARKSGATAIYCFYAGAEAVNFVKQYAQFGLAGRIPLYASGFLTEGGVLAAQGDAARGIWTTLNYAPGLDNPANHRFVRAYRARAGEPPTTYAMATYDAAAVLDEALSRIDGEVTGEKIAAALGGVRAIDSPRGRWRFGRDRNPRQAYYLRRVVRRAGGDLDNAVVGELR